MNQLTSETETVDLTAEGGEEGGTEELSISCSTAKLARPVVAAVRGEDEASRVRSIFHPDDWTAGQGETRKKEQKEKKEG